MDLALARQQPERALELAEGLEASLDPAPTDGPRRVGPPHLKRLRGEALATLGRTAEAESLLRTEHEAALAQGLLPRLWRSGVALGNLYRIAGRIEESDGAFSAAHAVIEQLARRVPDEPVAALDGVSLRECFRRSATAGIGQSRGTSATGRGALLGLTPREVAVLRLLAAGHSDREIATALVISVRTVEHHVSRILMKLGVRRRSGATAYALRHGLLSAEDLDG